MPADGLTPDPLREIAERVRVISEESTRLFAQLMESERRFRRLARAVWQVEEGERRRLSRALHDGLGQVLTALKIQLELLERDVGESQDDLRARLAGALELAERALAETRELSRLLRPQVLDDLGLIAALRWLARTLHESTGLTIELCCPEGDERLDPDIETLVFRIVQEGLTNVLRHSRAVRASVELERGATSLTVRVVDSGHGFDPSVVLADGGAGGTGLRGLRDRAELFGGRLSIRARPGGGTCLEVELPTELAALEGP